MCWGQLVFYWSKVKTVSKKGLILLVNIKKAVYIPW